jgi:hypothetical protein
MLIVYTLKTGGPMRILIDEMILIPNYTLVIGFMHLDLGGYDGVVNEAEGNLNISRLAFPACGETRRIQF